MIVADVNFVVYLLVHGPQSAAAQAAFDRDGTWIAPEVWHHEILNVLATSVRPVTSGGPENETWDIEGSLARR